MILILIYCFLLIFLWFSLKLFTSSLYYFGWFILFLSWVDLIKMFIFKLNFLFKTHFLVPLSFFYCYHYHLLNSRMFSVLMQHTLSLCSYIIHLSLIQLLFLFFRLGNAQFIIWSVQACFNTFCNVWVNVCCFYLDYKYASIHITKLCLFSMFWF